MQIISIINQKGGVGKSTTATTLHAGLNKRGLKALLIDLDAQGNTSEILGATPAQTSILEALKKPARAGEAIQHTAQGDIIAYDIGLGVDGSFKNEYALKEMLSALRGKYDYIIIDTPPALSTITVNALVASSSVIIPAQADILSLKGISQLMNTIEPIRKLRNPNLHIAGILLTRYNERTILSQQIAQQAEQLAKQYKTKVFKAKIREAIAIKEGQTVQKDIFTYAPDSNPAQDYKAFIKELLGGLK